MKISSILTAAVAAATLLSSAPAMAGHMPSCKGAMVYAMPSKMMYMTKGMHGYGNMKGGKWMCEAAAKAKGYHKAAMSGGM